MKRALLLVLAVVGLRLAERAAFAEKPVILVLPLAAGSVGDAARGFDARLLVDLQDTGRVTTVTAAEEPDCATPACLAQLATTSGASAVLSISAVRERRRIALFAALIDAKTQATTRRSELANLSAAQLASTAAVDVARDIAGAPAGPTVLGVIRPAQAQDLGDALAGQLAALGTFQVTALDADRASLTHRADVVIAQLAITERVHHVHHYLDGALTATLSITDLATRQVVFAKTVTVTASRRARKASRTEVAGALAADAVAQWLTAFKASGLEAQLQQGTTR